MAWYPSTNYLDGMVKRYLTFRKLNNAVKALEVDLKSEKDKGFKVDKIIQHLLHFIHGYDVEGLTSYWTYLKDSFFNRFAKYHLAAVEKYEADLYRLYMVHASQNSKTKELRACLQKLTELDNLPGLSDWYSLLFTNASDTKSNFAPYFTRQWNETFLVSLHNFLSATFSCMPAPELVRSCADDGHAISKLERHNDQLKTEMRRDSETESLSPASCPNVPYIQQLGRPSSAGSRSEGKDSARKGVSKVVPMQKSPKERSGSQEDNLGLEAASSAFSANRPDHSPSSGAARNPERPILSKKSQSLDIALVSGGRNGVALSPVASKSVNLDDSNIETVVLKIPDSHPVSTSPEISYEKSIVLGKHQSAATPSLPIKNSPIKTPHLAGKLGNVFLSDSKSIVGSYPFSTGSPLAPEKDPFLVLSQEIFFEHHSSIVQCKFDNLGTSIASVDSQGVVKAWQSETVAKSFATVMMHSPIQCLEWCTKPVDTLALGTLNGTLRFFDVARNSTIKEASVEDPHCALVNIRMHPSGNSFVSSSGKPSDVKQPSSQCSGQALLWDIQPANVTLSRKLSGGTSLMTCLDYNHNGNMLVAGDVTGCISLFDTKTCAVIHSSRAHTGSVCSVQFSSDENFVFSIGTGRELKAWDIHHLSKPAVKFTVASTTPSKDQGSRPAFTLSPDGNHALMSSGVKGVVREIDTTSQTLKTVLSLSEHKAPVAALDWISSKACGHCLTGSTDGRIHVTTLLLQ